MGWPSNRTMPSSKRCSPTRSVRWLFFKGHLSKEIVMLVRWETLELVPGSFVKKSLRQTYSDLLFSVKIENDQELNFPFS